MIPPTKGAINMAKTKQATEVEPLSAKAAATALGTDARTLRKFLRKSNGLVGQGQRWMIEADSIPALREEFTAWIQRAGTSSRSTTGIPADAQTDAEVEELELDELEDL